jgi:hypothetical protein
LIYKLISTISTSKESATRESTSLTSEDKPECHIRNLSEIELGNRIPAVIVTTVGDGNPVVTVVTVTPEKALSVGVQSAKTAVSILCGSAIELGYYLRLYPGQSILEQC